MSARKSGAPETVALNEMSEATERTEPTAHALPQTAKRALWWSILNNLVGRAGTTLMGIVLARILIPEDYGIYAVALVTFNVLVSMNELGVSVAIVRWPGDVDRIAPTVATLATAASVVLWIAMFAVAPLIADALNAPEATWLIRVLSAAVLIDAVTAVPSALMTREFMQRERMIADTIGFVFSSTTAIALAFAGLGAWALVASALLGNIVNCLFIVRYAPRRYPFGFDKSAARELLSFGLPLAAASLMVMAMLNLDYIVVGVHLGPEVLGFYLLAFNLSAWPVNMFSAPARRISLPLFARLHHGENTDASAAFVRVFTVLLLVTLPACLMLALFAEPLVRLVYGETWAPSATLLTWLMLLALTRVLGELVYDFLTALGHSRGNMVVQAIWLVALLIALPIGVALGGAKGVAIAHAVVCLLVVLPVFAVALSRAGVSIRSIAGQIARPLAGGVAATAVGAGVGLLVGGDIGRLLLGGALVGLVYLAAVFPMRTILRPAGVAS